MGELRPTVLIWEHSLPLETRPSPTWIRVTMLKLDVAGETVLVYVGSKNWGRWVCAFLGRNTFTLNRLPFRSGSLKVKDMNVHRWVYPTFGPLSSRLSRLLAYIGTDTVRSGIYDFREMSVTARIYLLPFPR